MNYEKKYKLLREAVMLGEKSKTELAEGGRSEWRRAYWEGQLSAYKFLKGYIEQMLEDEGEN
jgi:hypothetical protein